MDFSGVPVVELLKVLFWLLLLPAEHDLVIIFEEEEKQEVHLNR